MSEPAAGDETCRTCGARSGNVFHEVARVPVHCCRLIPDRESALAAETGRLRLVFCSACGAIHNDAFDPDAIDYRENYEADQAFSPLFREFAEGLAGHLVERYGLRDRDVVEVGCGGGYFLDLLCRAGHNRGVGIDPVHVPPAARPPAREGLRFIEDFYGLEHAGLPVDLLCCRHTLEHLPDPQRFVSLVRRTLPAAKPDGSGPIVFFEVPDVERVLDELAFWDLYYEHCSYFSLGSFERLFRRCGFEILDLAKGFDDQYLLLEARPCGPDGETTANAPASTDAGDDRARIAGAVARFEEEVPAMIDEWRGRITTLQRDGRKTVLWGAGSKAVGFLATLGPEVRDSVERVVDINPRKQGMYLSGTGQAIVSPAALTDAAPDLVLVMNPVYLDEIRATLHGLGLHPQLEAV